VCVCVCVCVFLGTGDHGGASDAERIAALFAFTTRSVFVERDVRTRVAQIDLVPTLALLIDVPIPFGNLGMVLCARRVVVCLL
jgi:phosphatidylinositol glycan class O